MWVLFLRSFFSLPQNCSISTQISEKLHLIFKYFNFCLLCCFLCFLLHIVQFSRYIFGLPQLKLLACANLCPINYPSLNNRLVGSNGLTMLRLPRPYTFVYALVFVCAYDPTPLLWLWWAQMDSNHRPRAYQARALTA